jgi:nucleoside-diphosphate-sugar epimerase
VIPVTIRRILQGGAPVVEGDGTQTRDFTFVKDTVRLALALCEHEEAWGEAFHVAAGQEVGISMLIDMICRAMHYDGPVERRPARLGDHRRHVADVSRLRAVLPLDAVTSVEEGIAETVAWYRASALADVS